MRRFKCVFVAMTIFAVAVGADAVLAGTISGTVTESNTGVPISLGAVTIYNASGTSQGNAYPDLNGNYSKGGLVAGTYFARTSSTNHLDELWDNIPCVQGNCVVTNGTPITVTSSGTAIANFILDKGGTIAGTLTDSTTALPISAGAVTIYNAGGTSLGNAYPDLNGNFTKSGLLPGNYFARTSGTNHLDELWDNIPCVQGNCVVTNGSPITVNATGTTVANFVLDKGGTISGALTDSTTLVGISSGAVTIYNAGGTSLGNAYPDLNGNYSKSGLVAGTYFARTSGTNHLDELWNDIPCVQGNCVVTNGSPITVSSTSTAIANFVLDKGGTINGTLTDASTNSPISSGAVTIYNAGGTSLGNAYPDLNGNYSKSGLVGGTYFARTSGTNYLDELWNDIPCVYGNCVVTNGTPITVTSTSTATANFALDKGATISGALTDYMTGSPISSGAVTIYNAGGTSLGNAYPDLNGHYAKSGLLAGSYFARTSSTNHMDELWNNIPCPNGSCVVTNGTPIPVSLSGTAVANFQLANDMDGLFKDGFQ